MQYEFWIFKPNAFIWSAMKVNLVILLKNMSQVLYKSLSNQIKWIISIAQLMHDPEVELYLSEDLWWFRGSPPGTMARKGAHFHTNHHSIVFRSRLLKCSLIAQRELVTANMVTIIRQREESEPHGSHLVLTLEQTTNKVDNWDYLKKSSQDYKNYICFGFLWIPSMPEPLN